jgi:hypothetical protein
MHRLGVVLGWFACAGAGAGTDRAAAAQVDGRKRDGRLGPGRHGRGYILQRLGLRCLDTARDCRVLSAPVSEKVWRWITACVDRCVRARGAGASTEAYAASPQVYENKDQVKAEAGAGAGAGAVHQARRDRGLLRAVCAGHISFQVANPARGGAGALRGSTPQPRPASTCTCCLDIPGTRRPS